MVKRGGGSIIHIASVEGMLGVANHAAYVTGKSAIFVVALGQTAHENRVRPFRSRVGMRLDALSRRDC